jgi:hypothetical protein
MMCNGWLAVSDEQNLPRHDRGGASANTIAWSVRPLARHDAPDTPDRASFRFSLVVSWSAAAATAAAPMAPWQPHQVGKLLVNQPESDQLQRDDSSLAHPKIPSADLRPHDQGSASRGGRAAANSGSPGPYLGGCRPIGPACSAVALSPQTMDPP